MEQFDRELLQQESAGGSREREEAVIVAQEEYGRRVVEWEREVEALRTLTKEQIVAWRVGTRM